MLLGFYIGSTQYFKSHIKLRTRDIAHRNIDIYKLNPKILSTLEVLGNSLIMRKSKTNN